MTDQAPRHPLRDQAADAAADMPQPAFVMTGVVTARQIATAPYTVTVRLASGATVGPITYLGWYAPSVNDVVVCVQFGTRVLCLGAEAPTNLYVPPAPVVPPTPPAPPPAPPTVRTVSIAPVDMAYWSAWGWKTDDLIQGGPSNRAFWFYGGQIAAAKGAGTITAASILVQRVSASHGVNGAANVRLGTHGFATRPGSGGAGHGAVSVRAQLTRGQLANIALDGGQIASLNAGAAGLGLEPGGSSYTSPDYLRAAYGGASGQLSLTIAG